MKFLCDHMLGTLARWLRFLGHDVTYPGPIADNDLLATAARDERVLLTRDRELAGRVPGSLYIPSDDLEEELLQVMRAFALGSELNPVRCSVCNTPLETVPKADIAGKVPAQVLERQEEFWHCPTCGRHYWRGSHWTRMEERLRALRERSGDSAG